jgi:hypothetical protein
MADQQPRIMPRTLIEAVDRYVERELDDAAKFTNRQPLDESGVWSLHTLAAKCYAAGWADGEAAEGDRARAARLRERQAKEPVDV